MPAPTINTTTSVLDFDQFETWTYQPFAIGTVTHWSIEPVQPLGMTFSEAHGTLTGAVEHQGVYVVGIRAHNDDGASEPLVLAIGIAAAPQNRRTWAIDVDIDVVTRAATVPGQAAVLEKTGWWHAVKYRDDLLYHVRFWKGTTLLDLPLTILGATMKRTADGRVLAESDGWERLGTGSDAVWGLHVPLNDTKLRNEIRDVKTGPDDAVRALVAALEFEWLFDNTPVGPTPARASSQAMPVRVVMDQGQITEPEPEPEE